MAGVSSVGGGEKSRSCRHSATRGLPDTPKVFETGELPAVTVFLDKGALADSRNSSEFGVTHLMLGEPIFQGHG